MKEEYLVASCPYLNCAGQLKENICTVCGIKVSSSEEWSILMISQLKQTNKQGLWENKY